MPSSTKMSTRMLQHMGRISKRWLQWNRNQCGSDVPDLHGFHLAMALSRNEIRMSIPKDFLLRQLLVSPNRKVCFRYRHPGPGLPAAHTDEIVAWNYGAVPCFVHQAKIARS